MRLYWLIDQSTNETDYDTIQTHDNVRNHGNMGAFADVASLPTIREKPRPVTDSQKRIFIEKLKHTGNVVESCRWAEISRQQGHQIKVDEKLQKYVIIEKFVSGSPASADGLSSGSGDPYH